jgi:hypothetical protein
MIERLTAVEPKSVAGNGLGYDAGRRVEGALSGWRSCPCCPSVASGGSNKGSIGA